MPIIECRPNQNSWAQLGMVRRYRQVATFATAVVAIVGWTGVSVSVIQPRATLGASRVARAVASAKRRRPSAVVARAAFSEYVAGHSDAQLRRELRACRERRGEQPQPQQQQQQPRLNEAAADCPELKHRRFAVGYYSCPHQAGNRLHHFMNGLAWAAVTNRTLLWKYYDEEACRTVGWRYDKYICDHVGTKDSCDEVLELASWIPSHDEWSGVLDLPPYPTEASFWSTHPPPSMMGSAASRRGKAKSTRRAFREGSDERHAGIDASPAPLLHFGHLLGREIAVLEGERVRTYLLRTDRARRRAERLLSAGNRYLYGLMFNSSFAFGESVVENIDDANENGGSGLNLGVRAATTVAVHSRHSKPRDLGLNVSREVKCLKEVLRNRPSPCAIYVMSDRPKTLELLREAAARDLNCTAIVPAHRVGIGLHAEHGPYAGVGFFQDLAVASRARDGLVGPTGRSSTMLLEELMVFHRTNEEAVGRGGERNGPWVRCKYDKSYM